MYFLLVKEVTHITPNFLGGEEQNYFVNNTLPYQVKSRKITEELQFLLHLNMTHYFFFYKTSKNRYLKQIWPHTNQLIPSNEYLYKVLRILQKKLGQSAQLLFVQFN